MNRLLKILVIGFFLCTSLAVGGCEGTDTREDVDDAVEEMAGKKNLNRYQNAKDDLGAIQTQQTKRYHQLDEETE